MAIHALRVGCPAPVHRLVLVPHVVSRSAIVRRRSLDWLLDWPLGPQPHVMLVEHANRLRQAASELLADRGKRSYVAPGPDQLVTSDVADCADGHMTSRLWSSPVWVPGAVGVLTAALRRLRKSPGAKSAPAAVRLWQMAVFVTLAGGWGWAGETAPTDMPRHA